MLMTLPPTELVGWEFGHCPLKSRDFERMVRYLRDTGSRGVLEAEEMEGD